MVIIAVVLIVSEFFYFRNIEKGIGRIIEQQEATNNTANIAVENQISNSEIVENTISNLENLITNDTVEENTTTK